MPVRPALPLLLALLVPSLALAEAPAPEETAPAAVPALEVEEELRDVAVTLAPANLMFGVVKLNGELRVRDEWGLQVSLGAGSFKSVAVREAGGQLRWYAIGDFDHGMQVGLEVMYIDLQFDLEELNDAGVPVEAEAGLVATAVGPFVGYKIAFDGGFTLEAQLGIQRYGAKAHAGFDLSRLHEELDGVSATLAKEGSFYLPLTNVNLGWSF